MCYNMWADRLSYKGILLLFLESAGKENFVMDKMKELPLGERPYEKCRSFGSKALSDRELLSVILRTGTEGSSAYELSGEVLRLENGKEDVTSLTHLSREQLMSIKGIGGVKASQIMCIGEIAKRIATKRAKEGLSFLCPKTVADYYMESMRHLEYEEIMAAFVDTKCRLICDRIISTGTVNQSLFSPREIMIEALKCGAVGMTLLHNHPSGDCTPSQCDISSTEKVVEAGKLIGIPLLDHIIIGDRCYFSMKEQQLI